MRLHGGYIKLCIRKILCSKTTLKLSGGAAMKLFIERSQIKDVKSSLPLRSLSLCVFCEHESLSLTCVCVKDHQLPAKLRIRSE